MKKKRKHLYLKILGGNHRVKFHKTLVREGKERRWGQLGERPNGNIDIYCGSKYMVLDTAVHEILHAILKKIGFPKVSANEDLVGMLAMAISEVIIVNEKTLLKIIRTHQK